MNRHLIQKITKASGVSAGEIVLVHFWGEDADKSIANDFLWAVSSLGATPFLLQQSRTINRDVFLAAEEGCFDDRYFAMLSAFDAVLDVFTYRPVVLGYEIAEAKFNLYRNYMARLFSTLMKCKRLTQIRVPTAANAEESSLAAADYIERMTKAYDVDYDALSADCEKERERLRGTNRLTLRTGVDCELVFDLTGREWFVDAGDGDLPCGEVYIAPVEEKTHGAVYFEKLCIEDFGVYEHVILRIEDGRVLDCNNPQVSAFFKGLPKEDAVVCELGFGMNQNVTDLCGYTALDEKMAGTFHIAVGANDMFGGQNRASMHIDFVGKGQLEF